MQKISLLQRVTKNEMEAKMDGLKNGMEAKVDGIEFNMEDLKKDMEGLKEGLEKLLKENLPNGEKVVEKNHDEKKINANHDFIDSNDGFKTQHIQNIDMRNFDVKDLITWTLQMEQYFELHNTQTHKRYTLKLYI